MSVLQQITAPFRDVHVTGMMADDAACGNYRIRFPLEFLRRGGAQVQLIEKRLGDPPRGDVIIAQRQYDPGIFEMLMEMKDLGKTVLYEIDDNVHRVHPGSVAYSVYKPGGETCRGVEKFIRGCDGLFVTSAELASQYRHLNDRVWVLPNCFSGDTKILTADRGICALADLVGETVVVKTFDGVWRPGTVLCFGEQQLYKLTFSRVSTGRNVVQTCFATRNHRWLLSDGSVTDEIQIGDELAQPPMVDELDPEAIRHGFIFGDGSSHKARIDPDRATVIQGTGYCSIRLCGEDKKHLDLFEGYSVTYPKYANGDPVVYVGRKIGWKDLPFTTDPSYLAGFIHGWWLADGSKTLNSMAFQISTVNEEAADWLVEHAAYAGFTYVSRSVSKDRPGRYANAKPLHTILLSRNGRYRLLSIEAVGVAPVYCVQEPVTNSFVMANGLLTGNCIDFGYRDWESPVERDPRLQGYTVIGWAGSITHQDDWQPLAGVLDRVLDKYPSTIVALVSAYRTMEIFVERLGLPADRVVQLDPVDFPEYPKLPAQFDIGLVPVVSSPFNMAKCLDERTRVSTTYGLLPIGSLKEGSKIWSGTDWVEVLAMERQPVKEGLRVRTKRGYELLMTGNHRIMAGEGWKRADELTIGTRVPLSSWRFGKKYVHVPFPLWETRQSERKKAFNPADYESLPQVAINETWGEILGLFVGDGNVNNTHIRISVDGQDEDLVEHIVTLFDRIGLDARVLNQKTYSGEELRAKEVRVSCRKFVDFLEYLGLAENGKRRVRVPDVIWSSPASVVSAFLRGYFEADSHCRRDTSIQVVSKDLDFLKEVQVLLLGFGITSNRGTTRGSSQYADRIYGRLSLGRAEVDLFAQWIGYLSQRKQQSLATIVARPHSNAYRPIRWEDEIVSIEPEMLNPIDIQVPGQVFIAAGFVSHNSDLKIIEYAARKVPYVASKLAPYVRFHEDTGGQGGYIADSASKWVEAISRLVEDVEDRNRKAEFLFDYVRRERAYDTNAYRWAEALREARDFKLHQPETKRQYLVPEKPGRNDPCPCGSGKKYKRCHAPAWG